MIVMCKEKKAPLHTCVFPQSSRGRKEVGCEWQYSILGDMNSIYREANLDVTLPWSFLLGSWSWYKPNEATGFTI